MSAGLSRARLEAAIWSALGDYQHTSGGMLAHRQDVFVRALLRLADEYARGSSAAPDPTPDEVWAAAEAVRVAADRADKPGPVTVKARHAVLSRTAP